jgi:selenocysteine lyase/cysteine desulfurase
MTTSRDASPDTPPELTRRRFLAAGGAAAALALAPSRLLAAIESHTPPKPDLSSWSNVRAQFDLDKGLLHFSSFFLASHPKPVRDAIESYRRALDANPYLVVDHGMFTDESSNLQRKVCVEIAPYLGARPDEIALTPNTTTGLALVYHGLPLKPGDDVLTTTHDHYSHHESIRFATERAGATSRRIALYDRPEDADADEIVHRVVSALKPETRAVGVTWVHSSTGVRLPIRAIAEGLRSAQASRDEATRARLIVDGVHGLGAVDAVLADLGADFVCAGTHKWMFAPRGTGIMWARAENWARLRPIVPTFSSPSAYGAWLEDRAPSGPPTAADLAPLARRRPIRPLHRSQPPRRHRLSPHSRRL